MAVKGIPSYRPWEIEPIAAEFLEQYWDPAEPFVDIELIIERDLGVLIDYMASGVLRVVGQVARSVQTGRLAIIVDEQLADENPVRYRYTLAQEVSHLLLHRDLVESVRSAGDAHALQRRLTGEEYERIERDANWCAGALLLPRVPFERTARHSYAAWMRKIREAGASPVPSAVQKYVVGDLAKRFRVSAQAARIRLQRWPVKLYDAIASSARTGQPQIAPPLEED